MNLVKFKDVILHDEVFDKNFKAKYCFYVFFRYAFPFEKLTINQYVDLEKSQSIVGYEKDIDYIDLFDDTSETAAEIARKRLNNIDIAETDKINSINYYISCNEFAPDDKATIDELKQFRKLVAAWCLNINEETGEYDNMDIINEYDSTGKTLAMLDYYYKNMINNTIKDLNNFTSSSIYMLPNGRLNQFLDCGCMSQFALFDYNNIQNCDVIAIYKKAIYAYMVNKFSDYNYWKIFEDDVLKNIIYYIDEIIKVNLPLVNSDLSNAFGDCNCLTSSDSEQLRLQGILKNASKAFTYIKENNISVNKNFIYTSLYNWASMLYENMFWI